MFTKMGEIVMTVFSSLVNLKPVYSELFKNVLFHVFGILQHTMFLFKYDSSENAS